jgi:hypothetical protein
MLSAVGIILPVIDIVPVRVGEDEDILLLNVFQSVEVRYPSNKEVALPNFDFIDVDVSSPVFEPEKDKFGTFESPIISFVIPEIVPVKVGLVNIVALDSFVTFPSPISLAVYVGLVPAFAQA